MHLCTNLLLLPCSLWVVDKAGKLSQLKPVESRRDITGADWKYPVLGTASDGTPVLYCTQSSSVLTRISPTNGTPTVIPVQWPDAHASGAAGKQVLGCNSRGALLVATSHTHSDHFTRLYRIAPDGQATLVLRKGSSAQADDSESDSDEYEKENPSGSRDCWEGCTWEGNTVLNLLQYTVDPDGNLVGFTASNALVTITLPGSVSPAHLQQPLPGSSTVAHSLARDWGALLASGEGADVHLRCAEGAVVRAHSQLLLARWEYYRVLQRNIAAGMTGGSSAGEVDVSEHSAATMQLLLQYLYTGRVQLPELSTPQILDVSAPRAEEAGGSGAATAGQTSGAVGRRASRKRDAQGVIKQAGDANEGAAGTAHADPEGQVVQQVLLVMRAADALLLPDLCQVCLRLMQQQLEPDNALPLLLAAHQAQVEVLGRAVMGYVVRNIRGEGDVCCMLCGRWHWC
jgi:hypothetical protein